MSSVDRYLGELEALRTQIAVETLENVPQSDQNAYGFGKSVGRLEGLRLASGLLDRLLSESEKVDSGAGRHRSKT